MADLKQMIKAWDRPDKMTFFGAAAAGLLTIFPWFSVNSPFGSKSAIGLDSWNGWMALVFSAAVVTWFLAPKLFDAVPEPLKSNIGLIGTILACVLGPFVYFMRLRGSGAEIGIVDAGLTLFFWLAFLAAAAAVAGAVWKKMGSPQPGASGFGSGSGSPPPAPPPGPSPGAPA